MASPGFYPTDARFTITRVLPISSAFAGFFPFGAGIPRTASRCGLLGDPKMTASSSPGYELSKTDRAPVP
jgi:hypothetical protein